MRKLVRNDRGYPWNKQIVCYHATIAARTILNEGFKTRAQLAEQVHATGGGTDSAISLTLDIRVARAIVLGLRIARRIARGEQTLGGMIIQASHIAPQANQWVLNDQRLGDADLVYRLDHGLVPWKHGFAHDLSAKEFSALLASGAIVDGEELVRSPGPDVWVPMGSAERKSYAFRGFVPFAVLAGIKAEPPHQFFARYHWSYYKALLAWGDMSTKELYDPLFFMSDIEAIGRAEEDDIGILEMTIDADWLCADPIAAKAFGYEPFRYADHQWSDGCSHWMDMSVRSGNTMHDFSKPPEWDLPHPRDTVAYLGSHMAEMRVWDVALLKNIRLKENVDDVLWDVGRDWDDKLSQTDESDARQSVVDAPIAHPFFKPKTPHVRAR